MTGSSSARVALPTAQDWLCPNGSSPELALSCKVNVRLPNLSLPSNAAGCGALHASAPHRGYDCEAAKAQNLLKSFRGKYIIKYAGLIRDKEIIWTY